MTVYRFYENPTVAAGYWAGATLNVLGEQCTQILVEATSSDTEFDFIMTDDEDGK